MCGRFELKTSFVKLPKVLQQDYPSGLEIKYKPQDLIRPNEPVLVIKNEGKNENYLYVLGIYFTMD